MKAALRFIRLGPRRRWLVLQAAAALALAAIEVRLRPFARIAARLGPMQPARPAEARPAPDSPAAQVAWAVAAAARRMPFAASCLVQALAARALCQRCGLAATLHLGAERGQQGGAETHAWLEAGGVPITGYPLPAGMVEVGCFPGDQAHGGL